LAIDSGWWLKPRPGCFTSGNDTVPTLQEDGWALEPVWTGRENLATTGFRTPDRPARSRSLYRLSYPGPLTTTKLTDKLCVRKVMTLINSSTYAKVTRGIGVIP